MDVWGLQSGWDGLRMELGVRRQNARKAAASWGPGQLATSEADVVDYLVAQYSVNARHCTTNGPRTFPPPA